MTLAHFWLILPCLLSINGTFLTLSMDHKLIHEETDLLLLSHVAFWPSWRVFSSWIQLRLILWWGDSHWLCSCGLPYDHFGQFNMKSDSIQRLFQEANSWKPALLQDIYWVPLWDAAFLLKTLQTALSNSSHPFPCCGHVIIAPSRVSYKAP